MKTYLKVQNEISMIMFTWAIACLSLVLSLYVFKNIDLFFYSTYGMLFFLIVFSFLVIFHRLKVHKKYEKEDAFKALQSYIWSKNENVTLIIEKDKKKNGSALSDKYILLTDKWYEHAKQNGPEYAEATICHELYHISKKHPIFEWKKYKQLSLRKAVREKAYINAWLEEFEADRYGCEIFGNKEVFLGHMYEMQKQKNETDNKKKIKLKRPLSAHPTWEMRIRFIEQNIVPTYDNVAIEFNEYYH